MSATIVYLSRSPRFKYRCPINIALSLLKGAPVDLVEPACPHAARTTKAIQSDDMKAYNCIYVPPCELAHYRGSLVPPSDIANALGNSITPILFISEDLHYITS